MTNRYLSSSDLEEMEDDSEQPNRRTHAALEDTDGSEESEVYNEEFDGLKEQVYYDKLSDLRSLQEQLENGTHPEYQAAMRTVDHHQKERMRKNDLQLEVEEKRVEMEHIREKKRALREFEDKKAELRESLLQELEEKKRLIEQERYSLDLNGDSMEYKTANTRKLRRRPNEPTPVVEKRRKPFYPATSHLLDERDVEDDLRALRSGKPAPHQASKHKVSPGPLSAGTHSNEPRIESGKLFFDKKWFHKGQAVMVDCKDGSRFNAVLVCADNNFILLRKEGDNSRLKVTLAQLAHGKYLVKRRNTGLSTRD